MAETDEEIEPKPEPVTKTRSRAFSWNQVTLTWVGNLVIGALTVFAAVFGAQITAASQSDAVAQQIRAEREDTQREKRAEVYNAFLDSYNSYYYAVLAAKECLTQLAPGAAGCDSEYNDVLNLRHNTAGAANQVAIWGSDAAWAAISAAYDALPWRPGFSREGLVQTTFEYETFNDAFTQLLNVACVELNVSPRDDCTD